MLHPCRKSQVGAKPVITRYPEVSQRSAARDELLADFLVPEIELHFALGAEPVGSPSLGTLAFAANPASDQVFIVGVAALEAVIDIEKAVLYRSPAAGGSVYIPSTRTPSLEIPGTFGR
jgi:hypothetical protein